MSVGGWAQQNGVAGGWHHQDQSMTEQAEKAKMGIKEKGSGGSSISLTPLDLKADGDPTLALQEVSHVCTVRC